MQAYPITVDINGKAYRVQANGLVHVLESNRGEGFDWRVLNRTARFREHFAARHAAAKLAA